MSVSTVPGASALTRMPRGAKSAAIERVNDISAALAAAYIATCAEKRNAPAEITLTTAARGLALEVRQRVLHEEHRAAEVDVERLLPRLGR